MLQTLGFFTNVFSKAGEGIEVQETLKLCGENAERIFINELIDKISMKFMVNTS
ncbi:MAG: hypothetical protein Q9N62_09560 [Ghiorsea sp.]|nr:hypothetical protein [Ghiorsea sp.]